MLDVLGAGCLGCWMSLGAGCLRVLDVPGAGCPGAGCLMVLDVSGCWMSRVLDVWVLDVQMLDVQVLDVCESFLITDCHNIIQQFASCRFTEGVYTIKLLYWRLNILLLLS